MTRYKHFAIGTVYSIVETLYDTSDVKSKRETEILHINMEVNAKQVTQELSIPTIGIGAGPGCGHIHN